MAEDVALMGDQETAELLPAMEMIGGDLAAQMVKAEISQQIATARQYPRSIKRASENIQSLVTLDEASAKDCIYALPRGNKPISGPSIRLAECVAQCWGNNRVSARVVRIDLEDKVVIAEAIFHDLETNSAVKAEVRRRLTDKGGRILNADMQVVTGNAACSIARRNAILMGVPKAVWNKAYGAAEGVVKGDIRTLAERRHKAVASFAHFGVKPEEVYAALGVAGEEEVTVEHMPVLQGMFNAIKGGEATVEELFRGRGAQNAKQFARVADPLKDEESPKPDAVGKPGEGKSASAGDKPRGHTADEAAAADGKGPSGTDDALAKARAHGEDTARRGAARRAPKKLDGDEHAAERAAWEQAYDAAAEAIAAEAERAEG